MNENSERVLKVFVPHRCLLEPSGILLGFHERDTIIVTSIVSHEDLNSVNIHHHCPNLKVVGEWDNELLRPHESSDNIPYDELIFSMRNVDSAYPLCKLLQKGLNKYDRTDPMIILYHPDNITSSCYIVEKQLKDSNGTDTNLQLLARKLFEFKQSFENTAAKKIQSFVRFDPEWNITSIVFTKTLTLIAIFLKVLHWCFSCSLCNNKYLCHIPFVPAVIIQLKSRFCDLKKSVSSNTAILRKCNILSRHVADVILGILFMHWFIGNNMASSMAVSTMGWAHNAASQLLLLLDWLMDVPAGLKLNTYLDKFLGTFFIYHIYLWKGYLSFLGPKLATSLWLIALSGCLGLSVQLTLAQDLFSMMTLHIYCFYVYAARLYSVQLYVLKWLWKLFRGKPMPPILLRWGNHSSLYDVDRLFIGTLLFTVLLFLMPTTLVYYVVFTTLRLLVLGLHGMISYTVAILNRLPVYIFYLRLSRPAILASEPRFHVIKRDPSRPLYLALQVVPPSVGELLCYDVPPTATSIYSWSAFCHRIINGKLVYPWIDKAIK